MNFLTLFRSTFLLSLLLLLQNVQPSQSANVILGEDFDDSALTDILNSLLCFVIPCSDESLGWRNVFGPIAADTVGSVQSEPVATSYNADESEESNEIRQQLRTVALNLFTGFLQNRRNGDGGNRKLRGFAEAEEIMQVTSM